MSEVSIEYLQHLVTVPAAINGVDARFVLDSGIGLTLVRNELAEAAGAQRTDRSFTGRRMSGQAVALPLAEASVEFAGSTLERHEVGILDMSSFPDALAGIGGFLSLAFFSERPVPHQTPRTLQISPAPLDLLLTSHANGDVEKKSPPRRWALLFFAAAVARNRARQGVAKNHRAEKSTIGTQR